MCTDCNDSILNNTPTTQAYCNQCSKSALCSVKFPAECVIYNLDNELPSKLSNLNIPNKTNISTIFEKIDELLGSNFNIPITPLDTNTIDLTASGAGKHTVKADVKLSATLGNQLEIKNDGLYVKFNDLGKVKVSASDVSDYLENQVVGGTDGIVSITVEENQGLLQVLPNLDIACLLNEIKNNEEYRNLFCQIVGLCSSSTGQTPAVLPIVELKCNQASMPSYTIGTTATSSIIIPIDVTYSGTITVVISGNGLNGSVTTIVNPSTTQITVPVSFNGIGTLGTNTTTVNIIGTQNNPTCQLSYTVNSTASNKYISVRNLMSDSSKTITNFYINGADVITGDIEGGDDQTILANSYTTNPNNITLNIIGLSSGVTIIFNHKRNGTIIYTNSVTNNNSTLTFSSNISLADGDILEVSELFIQSATFSTTCTSEGCGTGQGATGFTFDFPVATTEPINIKVAYCSQGGPNNYGKACYGVQVLGGTLPYVPDVEDTQNLFWEFTIPSGVTTYDTGYLTNTGNSGIVCFDPCNSLYTEGRPKYIYFKISTPSNSNVVFTPTENWVVYSKI